MTSDLVYNSPIQRRCAESEEKESGRKRSFRGEYLKSFLFAIKLLYFQYYAVTFDYTEKLRNVLIGLRKRLV